MDIGDNVRIVGGIFAGKWGVIEGIDFFGSSYYVVIAGEAFEPGVRVLWTDVEPKT